MSQIDDIIKWEKLVNSGNVIDKDTIESDVNTLIKMRSIIKIDDILESILMSQHCWRTYKDSVEFVKGLIDLVIENSNEL